MMSEHPWKFGLIVPLYNESRRINIKEYEAFLSKNEHVKIIFVNDASVDNTLEILRTIQPLYHRQVEILSNLSNLGKGEAIRKGIIHVLETSLATQVAFMDADLSIPISDLIKFSNTLEASDASAVIGVRDLSDINHIKRTFSRKYLSYLFRYYVRMVFRLKIIDTQCGAKIFKREMAQRLFLQPFQTRWLSDLELLLRLQDYCYSKSLDFSAQLIPIPVTYYEDKTGSKFNFFERLRTSYDLVRLSMQYNFHHPANFSLGSGIW
jgi:dolichyl-phosphate beta-glucosyltransferase